MDPTVAYLTQDFVKPTAYLSAKFLVSLSHALQVFSGFPAYLLEVALEVRRAIDKLLAHVRVLFARFLAVFGGHRFQMFSVAISDIDSFLLHLGDPSGE